MANSHLFGVTLLASVAYLAAVVYGGAIQKRIAVYDAPQYGQQQVILQKRPREHEKGQDLSKVPGVAGVDYPIYRSVPDTSFDCGHVPAHPGMYANVESGCQAYHVCHDGREGSQGASFLCSNGTLFNQKEFTCDWWYNVNCADAPAFYNLNLDPLKNPYTPKPKPEEEVHHAQAEQQYYANEQY